MKQCSAAKCDMEHIGDNCRHGPSIRYRDLLSDFNVQTDKKTMKRHPADGLTEYELLRLDPADQLWTLGRRAEWHQRKTLSNAERGIRAAEVGCVLIGTVLAGYFLGDIGIAIVFVIACIAFIRGVAC